MLTSWSTGNMTLTAFQGNGQSGFQRSAPLALKRAVETLDGVPTLAGDGPDPRIDTSPNTFAGEK
jgi:hypothetical protein